MIEEVFHVGSFSVSPFGLMLVLALLAAYWQLRRGMLQLGAGDDEDASTIVFACGFLGIAGGKIYYAILVRDWQMLFDRAGIVWYGCLLGGFVGLALVFRMRRLPIGLTFDAAAPALALGYAVGRVGCFLVGDDYGVPTDLPWAVAFPVGLPPTTAGALRQQFGVDLASNIPDHQLLAVHPTQLYSTLASLVIFALAVRWLRGRRRPGNLFLIVLALLSVERFLVEIVRAKDDRFFGMFTLAQVISLVLLLITVALLIARRGMPAEEPAPAAKPGKSGRKRPAAGTAS